MTEAEANSDQTATYKSYPEGVELASWMLCKDGEYRNDCVVVIGSGRMGHEPRCGLPIAGIIHSGNMLGDIRMCRGHLDSAVQWMVPPGTPPDEYGAAYLARLRKRMERHRGA